MSFESILDGTKPIESQHAPLIAAQAMVDIAKSLREIVTLLANPPQIVADFDIADVPTPEPSGFEVIPRKKPAKAQTSA
jgi:hypothetical protein